VITPGGKIQTIAGTEAGFDGDGGAALAALLNEPSALVTDSAGNIWIADSGNDRVRKMNLAAAAMQIVPPSVVSAASMLVGPIAPG
jgi:hypothetical protein